jgi:hypothetical protein
MRIHVKLGAKRDGTLTALQMNILSNTGAYGCHGAAVLGHSTNESVIVYRCPNKKIDACAVYTRTRSPQGPSADTGCRRPFSPSSRRWTSWPAAWKWIPSSCACGTSSAPVTR